MKKYGVQFKSGVVCKNLKPPIVDLINFLTWCAEQIKRNIRITSMNDGKHRDDSFHYRDLAIDVRIWNLIYNLLTWKPRADQDHIDFIQWSLKEDFPHQYDFVVEKDHLHIEFDPK